MQSQSGVLPRLLNCFFEGVTKPQRFAEGLRLLADMLDCDQVSIKLWDRRGNWACLRTARQINRGWQVVVEDLPAPQPEWPKLASSLEPGCWSRVAIRPEKQDAALHEPSGAAAPDISSNSALMCLRLSTTKGAEGLMLVRQRAQQPPGNPGRLQIPSELIKSLITALELIVQFRQLNHRAACSDVLLDTIRMPLLMLDRSMRLLAANRHAQSLIERVTLSTGKQCVSLQGLTVRRFSAAVQEIGRAHV